MITALLIICAILFIIAMLHLTDTAYTKHARKKYQEHIDSMVNELFPPSSIQDSTLQTPAVNTYTQTHNEPDPPEDTVQHQEAKREMVANIRTYFNQRKLNEAIRDTEVMTEPLPTPPSI